MIDLRESVSFIYDYLAFFRDEGIKLSITGVVMCL